MRFALILFILIHATIRAEDDLFTGVPKNPVPIKIRTFLTQVQRAVESGEMVQLQRLVSPKGMNGSGWVLFKKRVGTIEKGRTVKHIEMIDGAADADIESSSNGVVIKATTKPTHTVVMRIEDSQGGLTTLELPAAEVADDVGNVDRWRLIAPVPVVPEGSTVRLEEAAHRRSAAPDSFQTEAEWAYLQAVLGRRKQMEESEAKLVGLAEGKARAQAQYIYTKLGWCRVNIGDPKKALEYFKKGFELSEGKNWLAEFGLAVGYFLNEEPEKAVRHFDHAAGVGMWLIDRDELDKYLKSAPDRERAPAFSLQALWMRAAAPL